MDDDCPYSVSSYYYRVEFQQRGAPHIHCLLWLEDEEQNPAPTFWNKDSDKNTEDVEEKISKIEKIASTLISASEDDAMCDEHNAKLQKYKGSQTYFACKDCFSANQNFEECDNHKSSAISIENCQECEKQKMLIKTFQTHNHTFTCKKKRNVIPVRKNEGHGRLDGKIEGENISNYSGCRFNFPQFPLNKTTFILGIPKDLSIEEVSNRKKDLKKIKKFLIRQTYSENKEESDQFKAFKTLTFLQFLFAVGMFTPEKTFETLSKDDKLEGYRRYINALSASVRGTGSVFLKRDTKDIMTNNFNRRLMSVHKANHDIQIVVDQVFFKNTYEHHLNSLFSVCLCSVCDWISDKK